MLRKTIVTLATSLTLAGMISMPAAASFATPSLAQQASVVQAIGNKLNINTASAQELAAALTGIGVKKAEQIIRLREQLGGFTELEQLLDVKGIGLKTLEKNQALISLE